MVVVNSTSHNGMNETLPRVGVASGRGSSEVTQVVNKRIPHTADLMGIATWNVRTMHKSVKLENIKAEMERGNITILGFTETRWKGNGDFMSDDYRIIFAGGNNNYRGVAFVLSKDAARDVVTIKQMSDRILLIRLNAKPVKITIIQVYMPTTEHEEEEVEEAYSIIDELLTETDGKDCTIIMGDFNAAVGEGSEEKTVGKYGLGKRN